MSEEPIAMTSEWVEPETPFEKKRKRITYQCPRCEHVYVRIFAAEPKRDPPCPNKHCVDLQQMKDLQRQVANLTRMLEEGRPPAHIGENVRVKAIDETAKIVMEDNKLTDLRDNIRPGETAVQKLPPKLQNAADGFFGGSKTVIGQPNRGGNAVQRRLEAMGRRAMNMKAPDATAVAPNQVLPKRRWDGNTVASYDPRRQN
jgi:hypothetical protein